MAETVASQRARYPLAAYNFRVTIGDTTMCFSEVSGLVQEYETLSYRDGFSYLEGGAVARYKKPISEITLTKGVFANPATKDLYSWMKTGEKRLLTLYLYDHEGEAVVSWTVEEAMVIKLEAPSFNADSNEVAIDTLTLRVSSVSVSGTEQS
jgi:phage tail-like protein